MIPQEKSGAVTRGLCEAFGVTTFEDIRMITGGLTSNLKFRIVVRGSPFLLRIILRTDSPAQHYTCMRAAAEAGLTPHVWYTSAEDRISITDFVEAVPLTASDAIVRLAAAIRSLHALPPFAGRANHLNTSCTFLMNKGAPLDGFLARFQAASLVPEREIAEAFTRYRQVTAIYSRDYADMVSCHNDLKPENLIFDGQRLWLVDWEAAFRNDRYSDLAVAANFLVTSDDEETMFLQEYFGQPPDQYQRARLFLMRQIAHMFHAMAFLLVGSSGNPVRWGENAPEYGDLHRRIWAGEVSSSDRPTMPAYGWVHWQQLLRNIRRPRFDEALEIVSDRHAGAVTA